MGSSRVFLAGFWLQEDGWEWGRWAINLPPATGGSWVTFFPAQTYCFLSVKGDDNNLGCSKDQRCDGYLDSAGQWGAGVQFCSQICEKT